MPVTENLVTEEDQNFKELFDIIDEDKSLNKIDKKMNKLDRKLNPLEEKYGTLLRESVLKFVNKKGVDYFKKIISKRGGYISSIKTKRGIDVNVALSNAFISPITYLEVYERNKERGEISFSFYQHYYWTDVSGWANFKSKEKLLSKMQKPREKRDGLEQKWIKMAKAEAKKYFENNKDKFGDHDINTLVDKFMSKITIRIQRPKRLGFIELFGKRIKGKSELHQISGSPWGTMKLGKSLNKDFQEINDKGSLANLNSEGEVVPFLSVEEMMNSLKNWTFSKYNDELIQNAEKFNDYRKIYFEKHSELEE